MSKIKQWIDVQKLKGADPLGEDHEDFVDDTYWYDKFCQYSHLPSVEMYDDGEAEDLE